MKKKMPHSNFFGGRIFIFILFLLNIHYASSQIDSYTIGIQQNKSGTNSKWSKNKLNDDSCGGTFRDKQVVITSPRYPNYYSKNVNCEYVFYSPFVCTNEFHIQFLNFNLEPSLNCNKDKVLIGENKYCGQVVGIMKYKATNGTLRINFISDNTIENKGFELLVTRLPCDSRDDNIIESSIINTSPISEQPIPIINKNRFRQNSIFSTNSQAIPTAPNPNSESSIPIVSNCLKSTHNIPQLTTSLPNCCLNVYNQQKFYLISTGFPNGLQFYNDCLYFIERHHSNVCRLRIEFKYFFLGDIQQLHSACIDSFLEIDGRQFCGCKTGSTYYTQLGQSPKSIRFSNVPRFGGIQGFVLEIVQELCPKRSFDSSSSNQLIHMNDPRRCSLNYISWLNTNTNQELLAKSMCIRNFG